MEINMNTPFSLHFFAQSYSAGVYGGKTYQCSGENCQTGQAPGVPNTDYISSSPFVLVPTILGLSIVVAVAVTAAKRLMKRSK